MAPPPCFAVSDLSFLGGKDSGNATGNSCATEVRFTASFGLSTLRTSTDFGESMIREAEEMLRGGV